MMLAVLMLALVSAPQLPQPKAEPTIQNPDWLDKPNGDDLADVYPEKAQIEGLGGSARMECGVTVSGILVNCHVLEESPPGYGFGEAVLKLAPKFKMTPRMRDGVAVASGTVVIPVRFLQPSAPEIGDGATFVRQLQWVSRPTALDIADVYPRVALQAGIAGRAGLACQIADDGKLTDCKVAGEQPAQLGFGAAALKLAAKFRAVTANDQGDRTAGAYALLPILFEAKQSPIPPSGK